RLVDQLEAGRRIAQPRLRYRLQTDRIGLNRSRLRLVGDGEQMRFDFDERGTAAQYLLAAVSAARHVPLTAPRAVMAAVRKGLRGTGAPGPALIAHLAGASGPGAWSPA